MSAPAAQPKRLCATGAPAACCSLLPELQLRAVVGRLPGRTRKEKKKNMEIERQNERERERERERDREREMGDKERPTRLQRWGDRSGVPKAKTKARAR